tara:strand:+ start:236 stop:763 length:528 start_codon:yes stop_codon:yes gene_type:complete
LAILPILEVPHRVLSTRARDLTADEFNPDLEQFVSSMAETMYAAPGVGLAAPQVGDGRRILVANLKGDVDEESADEFIAMINPVILERSEKTIRWEESCLSIPEYELTVERNHRIHVRWNDVNGDTQDGWFEEFPAVVVQHEMDHLDGVTLLDHSSRLKRSRYLARRKKARRVRD